jgi:hypothetical protein
LTARFAAGTLARLHQPTLERRQNMERHMIDLVALVGIVSVRARIR